MPLFKQIKVEHVSSALNKVLNENKCLVKKIESSKLKPNWENFVSPLQKVNEKLSRVWSQINHLNSVMNSDKLRVVYNKNLNKITKYHSELSQNEIIYKKFKKIRTSKDFVKLTNPQKKLLLMKLLDLS